MPQKNILQDEKQNIYLEVIYIFVRFIKLDLKSNFITNLTFF